MAPARQATHPFFLVAHVDLLKRHHLLGLLVRRLVHRPVPHQPHQQSWMAAKALRACRPKLLELRRRAPLSPVGTLTNDTILFVVVERLHGHSTWAWLQPGAVPKCSSGGSGGGSDGAAALVVLRAHTSLSDRQPQCAAASMLLDVRAVARPPAHTAVAARAVTQVAQHLLARAVNKGCPAPAGTNFVPDGRWAVRGARPDGG